MWLIYTINIEAIELCFATPEWYFSRLQQITINIAYVIALNLISYTLDRDY